ncbi:xanthine dehydrogenase family protein molybdopterin-binding subunit [Parendozoicomonas haliclonae]|uniref:Isoquinoline 1-oxidoreductase subunit beta n=1 Tax=Parendozoicomonas haliclonae TaxID=1960125 RepID=A0A1X7AGU6_9GAMM|nr:molybdopterin cofactor-binding domain-containing protein [Parendozoicomonas haliclonae]SMA39162.1 Isoquinoline 1-oxidoreductase subunit beta [Parendozoicomonas haliclonae]
MSEPTVSSSLSRRGFLKASMTAGGALTLGFTIPSISSAQDQQESWQANAWLEVDKDNQLTLIIDRVEMGQGTMTGLTTLVAEELSTSPDAILTRFAPAAKEYRNPLFNMQMTGGSTSLAVAWTHLREAAAAMGWLLTSSAADIWQVPHRECALSQGHVVHPAHGKLPWSQLIGVAQHKKLPSDIPLKPAGEFRYIGKRNQRTDAAPKSFGQADYGIDTKLPGMVHAVVIHSTYIGGTLKSYSADKAKNSAGVIDVFPIAQGIAVVAEKYWQARKAALLVEAQWEPGETGETSSEDIFNHYRQLLDEDDAKVIQREGYPNRVRKNASQLITAEYQVPFLAHATLEPQNCVAHVTDKGVEIWAPTQAPDLAQVAASRVTDFSPSDVTVHTTFLGGGFGRRLIQDFVEEAAAIAHRVKRPVKLLWSREDDTRNDHFRPAAMHRMTGSIDGNGYPELWHHSIACPTLMDWIVKDAAPAMFAGMPKWTFGTLANVGLAAQGTLAPDDHSPWEGADTISYALPNLMLDYTKAENTIPVTYWRSVGNSHTSFAVESFIDELAHAANTSPLTFRQNLLTDAPRAKKVLNIAAEKAGWGKAPAGRYQGIAFFFSFNTWVAQVAEVSVSGTTIKVEKVTCVVDCGTVVNPEIVKAQMEGGIIFGLTAALYGEITVNNGQVQQSNFHDYPLLRMNEIPDIDVHIIDSEEPPTGVGEPGLPPIAPAVANAVFAATGQRLRTLPLKLSA